MIQQETTRQEEIAWERRLEDRTIAPALHRRTLFWVWVGLLVAANLWGLYAYLTQLRYGLVVTGMRDRVSWALYISSFVFFIGISHAGTLISAILRVTNARWRTPVTRIAEFITVVALIVGAGFVVVDMGRPDRLLNVLLYGRWQSPIMWDVLAVSTYLVGSIAYLYLPMIPDLALFRDTISDRVGRFRAWLYRTLSAGWTGTPTQRTQLLRGITILMLLIIPIAVSVHTVVSWIFAMTLRPGWNSTVFGIFFVAGAIFSGIATLILLIAVLRKLYRLEEYITRQHFLYLGYLLASLALIMIYFNLSEYLTSGYKLEPIDEQLFRQIFLGSFSWMYWLYLFGGLVLPILLMLYRRTRTIAGVVVSAILVEGAMFLERYFLVVATFTVPLMPYPPSEYRPTWVEWSILLAAVSGFMLLVTIFVKVFPIMAVWEMKEHHRDALGEARR